jgi:glycosyltransferase involved in cell wall biosynthesis
VRKETAPAAGRTIDRLYTAPVTAFSAVLITQNEEQQIQAALESVSFCEERVVVDSGSTDRTREVAEAAGARVILHAPWPGFVAQRNFAVERASHDWILALDADERITPALRAEIGSLRARGLACAAYRIPRTAFYMGRWIRGTDWYPDAQVRIFDRRRARWMGKLVHESVRVEGGSDGCAPPSSTIPTPISPRTCARSISTRRCGRARRSMPDGARAPLRWP